MRKLALRAVVFGVTISGGVHAFGQGEENTPPVIQDVSWEIARNVGGDAMFGPWEPFVAFDPATENAFELDLILLTVTVFDPDFDGEEGDGIFFLNQTLWIPVPGYPAPEPPPIGEDRFQFFPEDEGLKPASGTTLEFEILFQVPAFVGRNQARLRGIIDFDVRWMFHLLVSNEQSPDCTSYVSGLVDLPCEEAVDAWNQFFYAVENPVLIAPNAPPFADAGADRTVPAGFEVILDGSRTFDAFNIGFDVGDANVFEKDTLTFTWEWLSGPVRVDPVQTDSRSPYAVVTLSVPNDPNDPNNQYYEYRLTVDDNVNALPSTDTVRITVLDQLPPMTPPIAVIEGPANAQPVRSVITLVSRSTDADHPEDPNGILLTYRWQQTNELGGPLAPEELLDAFQPLAGLTSKVSSWQALKVGTFHFRLLVDDGDFRSSARFSVEVIETETGGVTERADSGPTTQSTVSHDEGSSGSQNLPAPTLCGAGMLPVAVVPLGLCVLRRRIR